MCLQKSTDIIVIWIIGTGTSETGVQVLHHGSQTFWKKDECCLVY